MSRKNRGRKNSSSSAFQINGRTPKQHRREVEGNRVRKDCVPFVKMVCDQLAPGGWNYDSADDPSNQGWHGSKCDFFEITIEDAEDMFLSHNWAGQRRLKDNHAVDLAENVKEILDISLAIGPDNKPWLVNGQHNLWGIVLSQTTKRARITIYQCRDLQSIAKCYTAFDSPGGVRHEKEIIDAHITAGSIQTSVSAQHLKKWVADARAARNSFSRSGLSRTNTSRIEDARDPDIIAFAEFMESILIQNNIPWKMIRQLVPQGIGAAFFCMSSSDPLRARRFITMYLLGINLAQEHPCYVLRERILNKPQGFHADTMVSKYAGNTWVCWRKFCINARVRLLKSVKADAIPQYNAWKLADAQPLTEAAPVTDNLDVSNLQNRNVPQSV